FEDDPTLTPKESAAFCQIAEWLSDEATRRTPDAKVCSTLSQDRMTITHNAVPPDEAGPHWQLCNLGLRFAADDASATFSIMRQPDLGAIIEVTRKQQPEELLENAV